MNELMQQEVDRLQEVIKSLTQDQLAKIGAGINIKDNEGNYILSNNDFKVIRKTIGNNLVKRLKGKVIHPTFVEKEEDGVKRKYKTHPYKKPKDENNSVQS